MSRRVTRHHTSAGCSRVADVDRSINSTARKACKQLWMRENTHAAPVQHQPIEQLGESVGIGPVRHYCALAIVVTRQEVMTGKIA